MASFASLPQETISHILTLAYDDDDPASSSYAANKRGLLAAALVHSSWRRPAQELLTKELAFDYRNKHLLARFMRGGPAKGWKCRRLVIRYLTNDELAGVLGTAAPEGVREMIMDLEDDVKKPLFKMEALDKLYLLSGHKIMWNPLRGNVNWPHQLRFLKLDLTVTAFEDDAILTNSADTLHTVRLRLGGVNELNRLASLAKSLLKLTTISLQLPPLKQQDPAPPALITLLSSLPLVRHLSLVCLTPNQLEAALAALRPGQLRTLSTDLIAPDDYDTERPSRTKTEAFLASVGRCAASAAWAKDGGKWDVGLMGETGGASEFLEEDWEESVRWWGVKEKWDEVRKEAGARGVVVAAKEVGKVEEDDRW